MADALIARLKANTHPYEFSHLPYAGAGHFSGPPAFSAHEALGSGPFNLGGSPAGNAAGRADSWPRVLEFLRRHLG
jgi:dienelactone hydrolase